MWRHPALRPLSRDHFAALMVVRDVRWAAHSGVPAWIARANRELAIAWRDELSVHFDREDRHLRPLLNHAEARELDRQHADLRRAFGQLLACDEPDRQLALHCANALHDHVRWEESVLFVALQNRVDEGALKRAMATLDGNL